MEIQRLTILVTERDLQDAARELIPKDVAFDDLDIHIEPEGVRVKGVYQMFVPVSFEAFWKLGVDRGAVTAELTSFRTMGMPGNMLKSLIMNVIADAAKKEPWLTVEDQIIRADVDSLLKKNRLNVSTHLRAIRSEAGRLIVEGGSA